MINQVPDIFEYNPVFNGGTERMGLMFHQKVMGVMNNISKYNCIIIPSCKSGLLEQYVNDDKKDMIVWVHNLPSQFGSDTMNIMKSYKFIKKVKFIIAVSEYHKKAIIEELGIEEDKVYVIYNTFDSVESDKDKFDNIDKIKLLWTSGGERGLTILLNSIIEIGDKNITLDIFGNGVPGLFTPDNKVLNVDHPGITYHGRAHKREILKALRTSHIFAYPSIYKETFCISLVEAISANMLPIYPRLGAMGEVGLDIGMAYDYVDDYKEHQTILTEKLSSAFDLIRSGKYNPGNQSDLMNEKYSLDNFINSWLKLDSLI
jgi:glycosyltransferase involved in cell wall biosynthesis